jgi:hypothetical protein
VTSSSYTLTRLVVRCGPSSGNLYVSDGVTLRLRSCEISGAEGYGIYNYKGDVSLDGCTVHENASYGVYVATYGTLGDVTGCDFHDNLTPIRVPPNYLSEIDASNDLDGNVNDYVEVASGDVTSTGTWYDLGIPARFTGSVNIYSTITIQDGAEFEFEPSTGLKIGTTVSGGSLIANGSTYGIRFTSAAATPAAGDWYGLAFGSHTGLANLTGVTISHGGKTGGYSTCNGNLCFRASSGSVTNSVLSHSSGYGLYCALMSGKTLTRTGNTYTSNTLGSVSSDCP